VCGRSLLTFIAVPPLMIQITGADESSSQVDRWLHQNKIVSLSAILVMSLCTEDLISEPT
jgi:hypothetical protein